jgi:hypothetical protein
VSGRLRSRRLPRPTCWQSIPRLLTTPIRRRHGMLPALVRFGNSGLATRRDAQSFRLPRLTVSRRPDDRPQPASRQLLATRASPTNPALSWRAAFTRHRDRSSTR